MQLELLQKGPERPHALLLPREETREVNRLPPRTQARRYSDLGPPASGLLL